MAKATKKELSNCMSGHMDELGFDRTSIRERIHVFNRCSRAKDISTKEILQTDKIEKIFVGSIREGIGMRFCNDQDILQINHNVICTSDGNCITENEKIVFKMVLHGAPPGYTYLKLLSKETDSRAFENLKYALIRKRKGTFLSSKVFMTKNDDVFKLGDGIVSRNTIYRSQEGPSIPKHVQPGNIEKIFLSQLNLVDSTIDFVRAFPCMAHSFLQRWSKRKRQCGWPCKKTIAYVMTLPAHVVPVGRKESTTADLQWRICFTLAEIHLVQAFNNVQTKVFVLMKLIAKHLLLPLCKAITSYVVKMVMLWLVEKTPQKKFRQKNLISRLTDAILHLKRAVENNSLPSYMIPKRNMFAKKISKEEQHLVTEQLNFLLQNGTNMLKCYYLTDSPVHEKLESINYELYISNNFSKVHTCLIALFTTKQLADYCTKVFKCRSRSEMHLYNILFLWIPYFYKYGKRGFKDPQSYHLSSEFAISEKEEKKKMEQKKNNHNQMNTAGQTNGNESNANVYMVDKYGLSSEYLLMCSVFLMTIFLVFFIKFLYLFPKLQSRIPYLQDLSFHPGQE